MDRPSVARDIMVTDLITVSPETPVYQGIHLLLSHNITAAPVVDGERRFLGVLSERCCLSVLSIVAGLTVQTGVQTVESKASDFMARKLITFRTDTDVVDAIELMLRNRISGAPVVDDQGQLVGVFSERFSMRALLSMAYDQLPGARVGSYMNTDTARVIPHDLPLLAVAQKFLTTRYRRLPVVDGDRLVGQVSRRDVLRAEHYLTEILQNPLVGLRNADRDVERSDEVESSVRSSLGSGDAQTFMDVNARTVAEETDLLQIAGIFMNTNYRRLPVLHEDRLVGQISRRDVLSALHKQLTSSKRPEQALLYLSALGEPPSFSR